jgi:hypothetical protein
VKHGGKVSIMNHVEAGKKHVADLLVSKKETEYDLITFWSRIDADRRQQHAQKGGGRRESASTSIKMFQTAGDDKGKDKRSVYTLLCGVVARLRQWGGVGRRRGGCGGVQVRTWPHPTYCPLNKSLLTMLTKVS